VVYFFIEESHFKVLAK